MARASKFRRNLRRWLKMCGPKFAVETIEILAQPNERALLWGELQRLDWEAQLNR